MINLGLERPERPGESRGLVPLLAAALIAGAIRGGVGAVQGNQSKQRNKGYVNAAYRTSKQRLDTDQGVARQDIAESLNARGLAQGGDVSASPIHTAMVGTTRTGKQPIYGASGFGVTKMGDRDVTVENDDQKMTAQGPGPTSVGGQQVQDANVEMGLEQQDLEQKKDQALHENKAEYNNALLGAGVSAVGTGMSVYSAGKDIQASRAAAAAGRSKIHAALLSGSSFEGVHPNDPLGEPTSAWSTHPRSLLADPGQSNASFNNVG